MKIALINLAVNLPCLVCLIGAVYLVSNNNGYWGWFLLLGVIMGKTYTEEVTTKKVSAK